jgi:hypothetical protein
LQENVFCRFQASETHIFEAYGIGSIFYLFGGQNNESLGMILDNKNKNYFVKLGQLT